MSGGKKSEQQPNLTTRDIKSIDEVKPSISTQPETFLTCGFKRSRCQRSPSHQPITELLFSRTERCCFVLRQHGRGSMCYSVGDGSFLFDVMVQPYKNWIYMWQYYIKMLNGKFNGVSRRGLHLNHITHKKNKLNLVLTRIEIKGTQTRRSDRLWHVGGRTKRENLAEEWGMV